MSSLGVTGPPNKRLRQATLMTLFESRPVNRKFCVCSYVLCVGESDIQPLYSPVADTGRGRPSPFLTKGAVADDSPLLDKRERAANF